MLATITHLNHTRRQLFKLALTLGTLLLLVSFTTPAAAAGRIVWKQTTVKENPKRESWRLELEIHLPRAPDIAYVPMKFEFQPTAHYERSLVDGHEGPVERTIPLSNQQSLIESTDVGFLDAGSGVIQSRTRFTFKLTRAHDFVAGEYKVTIKDARSGQTIGVPSTLKFLGENPVIDRRSIVFTGSKKKKEEQEEEPQEQAEDSAPSEESTADEDLGDADEPETEGNQPPSVDERPGGGCQHSPGEPAPLGGLALGLLFALVLVVRRRRAA